MGFSRLNANFGLLWRLWMNNIFHCFQNLFSCSAIMPVSPLAPSVLLCTLVLSAAGVNFIVLHCGFIHASSGTISISCLNSK